MIPPITLKAKLTSLNSNGKWIQSVTEAPTFKKGAFTGKAKKAGHTAKEYPSVTRNSGASVNHRH